MGDILLAVVHMCIFPGGVFALAVGMLFKGIDRRVEARLQRRVGPPLIQPWKEYFHQRQTRENETIFRDYVGG